MAPDTELTEKEREFLDKALLEGEGVVWTGRPVPRYFDTMEKWALCFGSAFVLASLCFLCIVIFSEKGESFLGIAPYIAMLSIFFGIGVGFCTRPLRHFANMQRTVYVITDRRAIIITPQKWRGALQQMAYPLQPDMVRERNVDGDGGDLVLAYTVGAYQNRRPVLKEIGFTGLPHLRPVEETLCRLAGITPPDDSAKHPDYESSLERDEREYLQSCLLPGEHLVWDGRPSTRLLRGGAWAAFLFGGVWLSLVLFLTIGFLMNDTPTATWDDGSPAPVWLLWVFLAPFHLIGWGMVAGPFVQRHRRNKFLFAVTNRRVILAKPHAHCSGYRHKTCPLVEGVVTGRDQHFNGTGDLSFYHNGVELEFHDLPHVQEVEELVHRLTEARKNP